MKAYLVSIIVLNFGILSNAATAELVELRQNTKAFLLDRHCVNCHSAKLGHQPIDRAMKVFNLDTDNWYSTMSNRQLLVFKRRIFDKLSPDELKEMKGDPNELSLNVKQRQLVSRFIDKELENRRDNPFERALKK